MHARVTRLQAKQDRDQATRMVERVIPEAERQPGFLAGYWMLDRAKGTMLAVTLTESEAAVAATEGTAEEVRADAAKALKTTPDAMSVERYEVVGAAGRLAQTTGRS